MITILSFWALGLFAILFWVDRNLILGTFLQSQMEVLKITKAIFSQNYPINLLMTLNKKNQYLYLNDRIRLHDWFYIFELSFLPFNYIDVIHNYNILIKSII